MKCSIPRRARRARTRSLMAGAACILPNLVFSAALDTGNPDVSVTWDNTFRYNTGVRVQGRDSAIANTPLMSMGDYAFDRGDVVTNRFDLLSELQVDYRKELGLRVSAAAWYDSVYHGRSVRQNPALSGIQTYDSADYSSYTRRWYAGPSGEIVDGYVFGNVNLGDAPTTVKLGRHTILWGEAVALSAHSVSAGQAPTDVRKLFASPGITAKEVALPIGQLSAVSQVTPELSVAAQYYYEWRETRIPEGGTYLMDADFLFNGPDQFGVAPLRNGKMVKPRKNGDWGVNMRWTPDWLGGATLGAYARDYTEKAFWLGFGPAQYQASFGRHVRLFGVSLSKNLAGTSFGLEFSTRRNAALNSVNVDPNLEGARGTTYHLLVNGIKLGGPTALWDSSALVMELGYSRLASITANSALYKGCAQLGQRVDQGCSSKDHWQTFIAFNPTWTGVMAGLDLTGNFNLMYGLKGNTATVDGTGREKAGSFAVGITADYNMKHKLTVNYNGYMATHNVVGGVVQSSNGNQVQDRGWVSLSYETTF